MIDIKRITSITRERDTYKFYLDDGERCYTFSVGDKRRLLGLKGAPISTNPFGSNNTFLLEMYEATQNGAPYVYNLVREYIDRIISSNDFTTIEKIGICAEFCRNSYSLPSFLEKNWREYLNTLKAHKEKIPHQMEDIITLIKEKEFANICQKYNLDIDIVKKYFTVSSANEFFKVKVLRESYKNIIKRANKLDEIYNAIYAAVGVPDRDTFQNRYGITLGDKGYARNRLLNGIGDLSRYYDTCEHLISELQLTDFEYTEDIHSDYEKLKNLYTIKQEKAKEENFAKYQTQDLFFESDGYKIYIPTTYEELVKIGKYFHNCAAEYEWRNFLSETSDVLHRRLVVVVDSNDKWQVCVDIDNDKNIRQYLGNCNSTIEDCRLKNFRIKYQEYLYTI